MIIVPLYWIFLTIVCFCAVLALDITEQVVIKGRLAVLRCDTNLEATWSRQDYKLPNNTLIYINYIVIPQVTLEDQGIYICTTKNSKGEELLQKNRLIVAGKSHLLLQCSFNA